MWWAEEKEFDNHSSQPTNHKHIQDLKSAFSNFGLTVLSRF